MLAASLLVSSSSVPEVLWSLLFSADSSVGTGVSSPVVQTSFKKLPLRIKAMKILF